MSRRKRQRGIFGPSKLGDQQAAEALCQAIEFDHGAIVVHGDAQSLATSLGGKSIGSMSPGGVALYLIALLLAARV